MTAIPLKLLRQSILAIFFIPTANLAFAQKELKSWNTAGLTLSFTKKFDLRFSHLRGFNVSNGFSSDFNQSSAQVSYNLTKQWEIASGYTFGGSNSLTDGGSRFVGKVVYKTTLADALGWSNSIQGEVHSASETRYHYRFIYHTRLSIKKRLDFLRLSPSVSYSLFYNIGGNPIQYYDSKTQAPAVKQTPDGLHRGRLMLSLNSKLTKNFSLSAFYMMQREFNLLTDEFHRMNITKPTTGRIVRPFDNYNVIGLSLQCDINLYSKKK